MWGAGLGDGVMDADMWGGEYSIDERGMWTRLIGTREEENGRLWVTAARWENVSMVFAAV